VNILDLESISTAGSVGFIIIFGIVNFVGFKTSKDTSSNKIIPIVGCTLCVLALVILINQQYKSNLTGVLVSGAIIALCFIAEWIYKTSEKKA
jgi:FtsH-binding integral membrane protein